jgi:hypothetical protein
MKGVEKIKGERILKNKKIYSFQVKQFFFEEFLKISKKKEKKEERSFRVSLQKFSFQKNFFYP